MSLLGPGGQVQPDNGKAVQRDISRKSICCLKLGLFKLSCTRCITGYKTARPWGYICRIISKLKQISQKWCRGWWYTPTTAEDASSFRASQTSPLPFAQTSWPSLRITQLPWPRLPSPLASWLLLLRLSSRTCPWASSSWPGYPFPSPPRPCWWTW